MNRADDRFCGGCAKPLRMVLGTAKPITKEEKFDATTPIDLRDFLSE